MVFPLNPFKSRGLWHLTVLILLGLIFLIFHGYHEIQKLNQLAQKRETLIQFNQELNHKNEEMYRQVSRLEHDPVYLEEIARKEFGLVKPDEIIFFLDEDHKKEATLNVPRPQFKSP
jgi:cell division protein FtsB